MKLNSEIQKKIVSQWFKFLQSEICKEFELLERKKSIKFKRTFLKKKNWKKSEKKNEGGGTYFIIKDGNIFVGFIYLYPKIFNPIAIINTPPTALICSINSIGTKSLYIYANNVSPP